MAHATEAPPPPRQHRPELDPRLEAIILRCLEKRPDDRYADIPSFAAALAPFASASGKVDATRLMGRTVRTVDERPRRAAAGDDDELCDVLMPKEFTTELTEVLIQHVPSLTGTQIAQIRQHLVDLARSHGWVES